MWLLVDLQIIAHLKGYHEGIHDSGDGRVAKYGKMK